MESIGRERGNDRPIAEQAFSLNPAEFPATSRKVLFSVAMSFGAIRVGRVAVMAVSIAFSQAPSACFAQSSGKASTAPDRAVAEAYGPFDKLELFGFFSAGPFAAYALQVIQQRGTSFTPDARFIASFPYSAQQEILRNIKPRAPKAISPDRDAAYELLRRALDAKQGRRFAVATEMYEQALQLAPDSATVHLAYAASLLLSQNHRGAETQVRQSLRLWPENAEGHAILAACLTAQKQFAEGESESREALRLYPGHNLSTFTLGVSLIHEQKFKDAIPFLRSAIAILPNMPALKKFLGISLIETGEVADGISLLSWYTKAASEDAEGHYYLGVAFRLQGNSEGARSEFVEALRLQPGNAQYEAAAHPDALQNGPDAERGPKSEDGSISQNVYTNRFFGFTYEFPAGWNILSADASRSMIEIGGGLISTGDPTEADLKKVAARKGHPLLFVMAPRAANRPISLETVMVNALELGTLSGLTPETYLKAIGQRLKQTGVPMEFSGAPQELILGGKSFWKGTFEIQTTTGTGYVSQFVAADKGYLLMFTIASRDLASLSGIEKSMESIKFVEHVN